MAIGDNRPHWFPQHLTDSDIEKISEAVRLAEEKTTGEIVPMVVRSSTTLGHVPIVLTLALFSLSLFLEFEFNHEITAALGGIAQWVVAPVTLLICFLISWPLAKLNSVARFLTSNYDEAHSVAVRAELEFHRGHYAKTAESTAILIFVSLLERRAVVLADKSIAQKLGSDVWDEIVGLLLSGLRQGDFVGGWQKAIERSGALLAEHFPASSHDKNELSNRLVIKD